MIEPSENVIPSQLTVDAFQISPGREFRVFWIELELNGTWYSTKNTHTIFFSRWPHNSSNSSCKLCGFIYRFARKSMALRQWCWNLKFPTHSKTTIPCSTALLVTLGVGCSVEVDDDSKSAAILGVKNSEVRDGNRVYRNGQQKIYEMRSSSMERASAEFTWYKSVSSVSSVELTK